MMDMSSSSSDNLQQPLLPDAPSAVTAKDVETAEILNEWNASVSDFLAQDGGEENSNCYCQMDGDFVAETTENMNDSIRQHDDNSSTTTPTHWTWTQKACKLFQTTLLPDSEITIGTYAVPLLENEMMDNEGEHSHSSVPDDRDSGRNHRKPRKLVQNIAVIKFAKLVLLTFLLISFVRFVVVRYFPDRDDSLRLSEIFFYEGDSIVKDLAVFFIIGRLHHPDRTGVDTIEWVFFALLANIYFECQGFVSWMQHSVTLYEMHCVWPWQLWFFAGIVGIGSIAIALSHVWVAHQQGILWMKGIEFLVSFGIFVGPFLASPYFHFHHWFAGWWLGMHANIYDRWWSRATMAYCWGMYVNGIAVYGRDPLLTCDYARFLQTDQNCPIYSDHFVSERWIDDTEASSQDFRKQPVYTAASMLFDWARGKFLLKVGINYDDFEPADWRNCSSSGYHP